MTRPPMTIETEFPDFDATHEFNMLATLLPEFVDSSWHNESCPSLIHELPDESRVQIFVDYIDPASREFPENGCRFMVTATDSDCAHIDAASRNFATLPRAAIWASLALAALQGARLTDLNAACRLVQDAASQTDGGIAGLYFDSGEFSDNPQGDFAAMPYANRLAHMLAYAALELIYTGTESE